MYIISNRLKSGICKCYIKGTHTVCFSIFFSQCSSKAYTPRVEFYCETTSFTLSSRCFIIFSAIQTNIVILCLETRGRCSLTLTSKKAIF